ncbi:MAG: DNA-methyltransferase [Thermodesulfobacteriota bacterium]
MEATSTRHSIYFENARKMAPLKDGSVDLVVTSPPYPMIEMWEDSFIRQDKAIETAMKDCDGPGAFERMHRLLDRVWDEVWRVLKPGGFACINIGDAVRKVGNDFGLYVNHARILTALQQRGFTALPAVIWRKQTNAPNKFMGSGMLPAGAYVTLEHEYVLILRKGGKREFDRPSDKTNRHSSAYFWEERNQWFSDIWLDLKGTRQQLMDNKTRKRSGAFPFELPYRLINMYSVKGDTVLDPFAGMGTTMFAAMASGRNSAGYEIAKDFHPAVCEKAEQIVSFANRRIGERLERHLDFVAQREAEKGPLKHVNAHYGFAVMTRQEVELTLEPLKSVEKTGKSSFKVTYEKAAAGQVKAAAGQQKTERTDPDPPVSKQADPEAPAAEIKNGPVQQTLFDS